MFFLFITPHFCPKYSLYDIFLKKSLQNIWSIEKIAVPLHSLSKKGSLSVGLRCYNFLLGAVVQFG